ncbi:hypothetical protein BC828DRAFT_375166 [Blastocladiella britannica]|nr:hypothetical protein BC828DRAFT_375166 [Blastocladiella britannica]
MPRWFTLAAAAVVVAHLAICATAGWPKGMQQVFWNPTVLYLPDQSRAYVLGGRISGTDTPPYAINDVAVLQLNYSFSVADANTASVQPAPFSLPSPDYRMAGLISQTAANSEEYTVVLLSGLNTGGVPPPRTYAINNLLHATDVSVINAVTTVPGFAYLGSPAWGSTVKPIVGGSSNSLVSDPAAYFYGNWSTVNNELFRLTFGGKLELVNINTSQPMPPPSGWGSLVRYNLTHLLVAGGNPGDNAAPKVPEIWLCNLVSNAWSKVLAAFF